MALTALDPRHDGVTLAAPEFDLLLDERCDAAYLVVPAILAGAEEVSIMVRLGSGFVCVALPEDVADRLGLPPMVRGGRRILGGVPSVTVDAARGVTTGISAADRAHTLRLLAHPGTDVDDLSRPGHVVPIRAGGARGARGRRSTAQAAMDLVAARGHVPVAAVTALVSPADPRRMAGAREAREWGSRLGWSVSTRC